MCTEFSLHKNITTATELCLEEPFCECVNEKGPSYYLVGVAIIIRACQSIKYV